MHSVIVIRINTNDVLILSCVTDAFCLDDDNYFDLKTLKLIPFDVITIDLHSKTFIHRCALGSILPTQFNLGIGIKEWIENHISCFVGRLVISAKILICNALEIIFVETYSQTPVFSVYNFAEHKNLMSTLKKVCVHGYIS